MPAGGVEASQGSLVGAVTELVLSAPLELTEPELVDLLEFVFAQHASTTKEGATEPTATALSVDNTDKKEEIIKYLHEHPFAISKKGITSLCKLSQFCLQKTDGDTKNSAEHQLWVLSSGALNTAAAVVSFNGNATAFFAALTGPTGNLERGKYLQRQYAQAAMQAHHAASKATQRRWMTPDDLPALWIIATLLSIGSAWMLSLYLFPTRQWV